VSRKPLPAVWRDAVRDSRELSATAKLVAFVLSTYMNRDGEAWPSRETLAFGCGLDVRNVTRNVSEPLREAEDAGFLDYPDNKGGRGKSNRYRARLPASAENRRQAEWERATEERALVAAEREELEALREEMAGCAGGFFDPKWLTPEWQEAKAAREPQREAEADDDDDDGERCPDCEWPYGLHKADCPNHDAESKPEVCPECGGAVV
jgi:Helix-turn-helix domain